MHINVSHILAGEVGEAADFDLKGENPNIPDLELTSPISGSLRVTRLEDGLRVKGRAELVERLECYRCLDDYDQPVGLSFDALYSYQPAEEDWPISPRGVIDLIPLLRQEILLGTPLRQLCREDCEGLCADCGQRNLKGHTHKVQASKAKSKKGS